MHFRGVGIAEPRVPDRCAALGGFISGAEIFVRAVQSRAFRGNQNFSLSLALEKKKGRLMCSSVCDVVASQIVKIVGTWSEH